MLPWGLFMCVFSFFFSSFSKFSTRISMLNIPFLCSLLVGNHKSYCVFENRLTEINENKSENHFKIFHGCKARDFKNKCFD